MERKLDGWEAEVLDAVKRDDRDEAIRQLDCHYLFAEAPDKVRVLNIKFDLVASNEEKVKVLNQKFDLVSSDEEKVKVLNQKFDLVASNEEKVKVLNQKFDLVSSDEEKVSVLDWKLEVLRNMGEGEAALNTKIETIAKLMPHMTPEVQSKLQEESTRATAALNGGQPTRGAVGSVGAPATHPGAEAGVGEKRALDDVIHTELTSLRETFDQRMESLEKTVKEQREESVRMSDISTRHIKTAFKWYDLEEADVQIQNVVPDIDPFVWDDRDEPLHEEEYLQYLRRFCRPRDLSWQSLRKFSTYLKVDLGPYKLSGTADVALVYASAVLTHRFLTDHKATLLVGEMKKKVDPADVCQSKAELLAHAKLQGSKGHALSMLSDLQDDWYFFWIHAAEKKFYSLRCERGAARHLLDCLFCNGPIDDVPQPILARSALEDLGPRRQHPAGGDADEDEQDLENFDVDGSLSAKDILQVKMQKVLHQLAAANPVWECMFS